MEQPVGAHEAAPCIDFRGLGGDVFLLQLGNLALTILTLGIYRFWGKTRVRRFLWRNTLLDGDPLEYRGTGLELFVGALLAILLISVPLGLVSVVLPAFVGRGSPALVITQGILLLLIYYLVGVGMYRSWRYILSRTAWRGIRGGMTEQGWRFGLYHFGLLMAQMFSLGFLTPWVGVRRWNRLTRDMRIGSLPLFADAHSRPIYGRFLIVWVAMIVLLVLFGVLLFATVDLPTEGPPSLTQILVLIVSIYGGLAVIGFIGAMLFARYHAAFLHETYGATRLGETMRLRFDVRGREVALFYLVNFALVAFTMGLGTLLLPWRHWAFHARRIVIDGAFDPTTMRQTDLVGPGQGEGIADAFDIAPF
ncbi:YjgN family protein [Sphingomonas jatrophae]|uniref:Uncharacterized membrane protein YjgN, DUF898 family n=1 Tax=Sphingomonas jatrophae TaxID=1166337 RepID=A0A1I6JUK1_9SPHN|nr:DUF898 family protein [Sphingomonas jatrophae]SFR82685.1 Uncharacterized membrane protein YjgN, DUF898 family [Sphingomonas jatrophae]